MVIYEIDFNKLPEKFCNIVKINNKSDYRKYANMGYYWCIKKSANGVILNRIPFNYYSKIDPTTTFKHVDKSLFDIIKEMERLQGLIPLYNNCLNRINFKL